MKHIILTMICAGALFSSCADSFLDQYPKGKWHSENMPENSQLKPEILVEAKIQEAYGKLRSWGAVWPYLAMNNYPTKESYKGSTQSDGGNDMLSFESMSYNPSNGLIADFYSTCYSTIFSANEAMGFIGEMELEENTDKNKVEKYKAEVTFIRSLMYYRLTQAFGGVPYIDKLLGKNEKSPARMNIDELRAKYIGDLEKVIDILPTRLDLISSGNSGRATKNAARAIIAKTYLYQKNWAQAKKFALDIINSGDNDLSTPFELIFDEDKEFGPESVLEINCELDHTNKIYMDSQFGEVQGFRGVPDLGWGFNNPTEDLIKGFEDGDPRLNATVLRNGDMIDGYTLKADEQSMGMFNKKAYAKKSEYEIKGRTQKDHGKWKNIRLIRYSDILLVYAEACCELNELPEALAKLEMVRNRARGGNTSVLPKRETSDQNELREFIRHERNVELALEFERFYDLVRWGIAGNEIDNFVEGKHELYPIPQTEIDKGEGVLVQNPGY